MISTSTEPAPTRLLTPDLFREVNATGTSDDLIAVGLALHHFTEVVRELVTIEPLKLHRATTILTKQILKRVWPDEDADENTLRVHIHRLRQKIEIAPSRPRYVVTERGAGYSFAPLPGGRMS